MKKFKNVKGQEYIIERTERSGRDDEHGKPTVLAYVKFMRTGYKAVRDLKDVSNEDPKLNKIFDESVRIEESTTTTIEENSFDEQEEEPAINMCDSLPIDLKSAETEEDTDKKTTEKEHNDIFVVTNMKTKKEELFTQIELNELIEDKKLDKEAIERILNGEQKSHKGWSFKRHER